MNEIVRVLVIDDEELIRLNLRALLEDMNFTVMEAANGREGLAIYEVEKPDIVLTDLRMPEMDGLSFIKALRARDPDTPVIVISGTGTLNDAIEAVRYGAWDYLTKPVQNADELSVRLRHALERGRLAAENRLHREQLEEKVRQRTRQLRESEQRYRRLLGSVTSYVYTVTVKMGRSVATVHRPGCETVTGFSPDEYRDDPGLWWNIILDDDRPLVAELSEAILTETAPLAVEHRIRHKDGSIRWIRNTLVPHRNKEGELTSYDGIIADITDQKQAEAEIRGLNAILEHRVVERTAELQNAIRQLEMFVYSVSHDLRAPLRHISGFCRILKEDYSPTLDADGQNCMNRVFAGCKQMEQLIDALLTFSRLSRQELHKVTVEPERIVRQVLQELEGELEGRRIDISVGNLPPCNADPMLLHQVFVNLISNALKYTRKRDVARIEIQCAPSEKAATYCIRDNGAGFDMRYADKLFGVFQRLHGPDEFEGTGVGLAIVQNIIQRHGGRIWAEAEVDRGATFYFILD